MPPSPIRIVILDDHLLIRSGIKGTVQDAADITVVGEGWAGEHLEPLIRTLQPDVVLLDLQMPERATDSARGDQLFRPQQALTVLHAAYPAVRFLVISQHVEVQLVMALAESGISGYLLKDDALTAALPQAIRIVASGGICLSPELTFRAARQAKSPRIALTTAQRDTLQFLVDHPDFDHEAMARALSLSANTVKNHLADARARLDVRTTIAAILLGLEQGLLQPPAASTWTK